MVLVIDKKPFEGTWWKFGAGFAAGQLALWLYLGHLIQPDFSLWKVVTRGFGVYGTFILASFLPFVLGRFGLRRIQWASLVGWFAALAAYVMLALFEPARRIPLLPFVSYLQIYSSFTVIGIVLELGRYVWIKVFEE